MSVSLPTSARGAGQWIVTVSFGFLSVAFFCRAVQLGLKWLRHVVDGEINFKAMTLGALIYGAICAVVAAVAFFLPPENHNRSGAQNAERGT